MTSGHDEQGRFTKGNTEGTGRKVSALKRALEEAVTEDDIKDIANALKEQAKAGDIKAAELLFNRLFGKPAQGKAEEPDTAGGFLFGGMTIEPIEIEDGGGQSCLTAADVRKLEERGFYEQEKE